MASTPAFLPARHRRVALAAALSGAGALALAAGLLVLGPARLLAQIEGDRGIVPLASTSDIQVSGVTVNTEGPNGEEARLEGWQLAAREAWKKAGGPAMPDGTIQSMVSAVVIERAQPPHVIPGISKRIIMEPSNFE